ncbi:MAG: hypothetical protein B7X04_00670 [Parcubacteria group bacterium 21-54-25]|nr:MAG: hypothetical protein B7X04_00670 [Parcubacteria group bacterium 21-54-25]HQU07978.1 class I SAM-dependent methyltransferase [Candidatus Paceibacterota bacterium]
MDSEIQKWVVYQSRITKPRPLVTRALPYVKEKGVALDLGAGSLHDVELLLKEGFKEVIAVDQTPQFREVSCPPESHFTYVEKRFGDYEFPSEHFDLVSAQLALPFVAPDEFKKLWSQIHNVLKTGGIFTGQFFSVRDDWFGKNDMTFHSEEEVHALAHGFEELVFEEQEYTEEIARKKHWHFFDLILRKK